MPLLVMVFVMMKLILLNVIMMVEIRAQPDVTSGSGCPGNFKCPDSGLPVFFLTGLRTYQSFRNGEKPLILFSAILKFTFCQLFFDDITTTKHGELPPAADSMCQ